MRRVLRFTPFTSRTVYITRKLTSISFGNRRRKQVIYILKHQKTKLNSQRKQMEGSTCLEQNEQNAQLGSTSWRPSNGSSGFPSINQKLRRAMAYPVCSPLHKERMERELLIGLHTRVFPFKIIQFPKDFSITTIGDERRAQLLPTLPRVRRV